MTSRLPHALCVLLLVSVLSPVAAWAEDDEGGTEAFRTFGDVMQVALPVIAGASTFFTHPDSATRWDREGTRQFARAYGSAWLSTYMLKALAEKMRPNGENRTSFPSGHTMSAFAGAGYIDGRYGWKWGVPAYLAAVATGVSRVESSWHFADDVLAGASIGLISNWIFVEPQPGRVSLLPTVAAGGVGVEVTVRGGDEFTPWVGDRPRGPGYRFQFGPAGVVENTLASKEPGAVEFDLADFDGRNDPITTAAGTVFYPVARRGMLRFAWAPFEAKDFGVFAGDTQFGGVVFPAGVETISGWRLHDLNLLYTYDLLSSSAWILSVGAGSGFFDSWARLEQQNGAVSARVTDRAFYPFGSVSTRWNLSRRWSVEAFGEGIAIGDEGFLLAGAGLTWQLDRHWDLGLQGEFYTREIDTSELRNVVRYRIGQLSLTRWW